MAKKLRVKIILFMLAFIFTAYSAMPVTALAASSFKTYKVIITTSKLSIRSIPSTKGKLLGYYLKNAVVDVTGQSGSWLKTSKGYISSSYTKKYTGSASTTTTAPVTSFKAYKAIITTSKLNIRNTPSTSGKIVGYYYANNIIDITGQAGSWLKTSKGYISSSYTKRYVPTTSRGGQVSENAGKYITMNKDEQLLLAPFGSGDERYAVKGKTYQIIDEKDGYFGIKIGSVKGYIPSTSAGILSGVPKNKLTLAWNYIYARSSNQLYYNDANDYVNRSSASIGLDVVSPTWFNVSGDASNPSSIKVDDIADKEYVTRAHKNGYEVWACFKEGSASRANKTFTDKTVRDRVITQVLNLSKQYNVDGINIDYEGIGGISQNKDGFTAFVKEFYSRAKVQGLTVSVDVVKPSTSQVWSKWYDRAALSTTVDYLMYMAYDEHVAGSNEAGSVGSYAWVEDGIKDILAEGVPASKLVLGIPFYLRDYSVLYLNTSYNAVMAVKSSKLYSQPSTSGTTKLADAAPGLILKNSGVVQGWDSVDYNGQQGYIDPYYVNNNSANNPIQPLNDSDGLKLPYDSVIVKSQSILYSQASEDSNYKIADIAVGSAMKFIAMSGDMFSVEYNGQTGYVPQRDSALVAKGNNILSAASVPGIILPYDTVVVNSQTAISSQPSEATGSSIADVKPGDTFKYTATSGNWYSVEYNGQQAYIPAGDTIYAAANTRKTYVLKSESLKMQTAFDRISTYGGTTYYDSSAKQQVGEYYKDGIKHIVWLETKDSMGWRMDFVNSYNLPGTAAWQLYEETQDIWDVIKSKMKN